MLAIEQQWQKLVPKSVIWFLDVIELYIPALAFLTLFVVFNAQIVARYIFHSPLVWSTEVCQLAFVWTALLGASYMRRMQGHVAFDMVFEAMSDRGKIYATLASNLLIAGVSLGSIPATLEYLAFLSTERTPMLHIPFNIGFAPLLMFLLMVGIYSIIDICLALRDSFGGNA